MAIYTKKGDGGETGLLGGSRIEKDSLKVSCYGTLDEANASLGLAYSLITDEELKKSIKNIQAKIFVIGAELASDEKGKDLLTNKIKRADISYLEKTIDRLDKKLGPLHKFIIPGETTASAALHQARSIIRRAERLIVKLDRLETVRDELKKYMNRLSDTVFMLARTEANHCFIEQVKQKVVQKLNQGDKVELCLKTAKKLAEWAEEAASKINVPITFTVVDEHGNTILLHRMEGSLLASIDLSENKAYSALALKMPTHEISEQAQPGADLYGISATNQNRIVTFGGGYPLILNGRVVGAIGVSGGTVQEDRKIAEEVLGQFNKVLR
ncbi:cob(I)yrinic acid a,c-diamide adenosyltransferase [Oceanobacillus halophilus]|uniref:Corrinoid adenosyltransferase n=1 Tax=Oceanobacillus halophilus TaxID=930130 RepID=A0A494ZT07_9BACI|nr:cob(I)yrinic acid a,c-diamide adenosyltransferase [Oceanobacillus halophilus]RKQ29247.1 cob(I)yrinic acid a,c-diamide adenosyltransferase [Oceanobacillus halophilus]